MSLKDMEDILHGCATPKYENSKTQWYTEWQKIDKKMHDTGYEICLRELKTVFQRETINFVSPSDHVTFFLLV